MQNQQNSAGQSQLPRLAVVGCGAAAKEFCLPVLSKYAGFQRSVVLVDSSPAQAQAMASEFGIQHHCTDYRQLPLDVDAAVVMTPHHLHAEHSIHFLQQGKPVFVEKPLGMTGQEAARMLDAATSGNTVLMVNNCRRLFPAYRRVGELIRSGQYGNVIRIDIDDGSPFDWNSVSAFYMRDAQKARGVLLDRGAHTVDLICWWLPKLPQLVEARYDAMGGAEALMTVRLACGPTSVQLAFSRLFKLKNCYRVQCESAEIRGRLFNPVNVELVRDGRVQSMRTGRPQLYHEYPWQLLMNFIQVVQGTAEPLFTASDVAPSIGLIEEAYREATLIDMPWYEKDPNIGLLKDRAKALFETEIPRSSS